MLLFEIKYHRHKNATTSNKTKRAGDILNDIERLHVISGKYNKECILENVKIRKFFVYLTDDEMRNYFEENNNKNKFLDFYFENQKTINFDEFTSNCSKTFRGAARKSFNPDFSDPNDYVIREFDSAVFKNSKTKLELKILEVVDGSINSLSIKEREETKVEVSNNKTESKTL